MSVLASLTPAQVVERYDVVLLDAYGVLNDHAGPRPGAAAFLQRLQRHGRAFGVVSNDASRSAAAAAARYADFGLAIPAERIVMSGAVLAPHFRRAGLEGERCVVLGPPDSLQWVRQAGGVVVPWQDPDADPRVVVICDDAGYDFLPAIESVIALAIARIDRGRPLDLVLPNPDLVFPKGPGRLGLTAGSIAMLVEVALAARYPLAPRRFVPLGKPEPGIFALARHQLGVPDDASVVMIGDQVGTDVAGANAAGIDSILLAGGVTDLTSIPATGPQPTWTMAALDD
jgi:HAD superfamily hydrolase (TIGR01459 family)